MVGADTPLQRALRAAIGEWTAGGGSLRGLAKAAGVNIASVVTFVNGDRDLRLAVAGRLAAALGLVLVPVVKGGKKGRG